MRAVVLCIVVAIAACTATKAPDVRVIGVVDAPRNEVVFVQVTNPAKRALRLTKLEYKFAAGHSTISEGELVLARDVPAGAAIVVEVPLNTDPPGTPMTLSGKLTAQLDEIVRTFQVFAQIQPEQVAK